MNQSPQSWSASIVSFCVSMLAACLALRIAAQLLLEALPVLLPVAAVVGLGLLGWRWWRYRSSRW